MSWLAIELHKHGMVKIGRFKLTSGLESPYYIDLRQLYSYPELRNRVVRELIERFEVIRYSDVIVGIATGGLALAAFIAAKLDKPLAYVRIERKEHGTKSLVEGNVIGKRVVIIDDVVTTGGSVEQAVMVLRTSGATPLAAVTIVDREQGARHRLKSIGVELYSLITSREIFEALYSTGLLSAKEYEEIIDYINKEGAKSQHK
ncbi:MAG: orotate phosphoribosyltransferase [Ignisphaera sp.]|jgi:orotate phosphoribosyltransferase|nr:orotate phosphoribosyltransferase [Ignisphaera sp.]MCC6056080.1 orotate phosphoribosyltransferase [Desulfurococcaceae archaeon]